MKKEKKTEQLSIPQARRLLTLLHTGLDYRVAYSKTVKAIFDRPVGTVGSVCIDTGNGAVTFRTPLRDLRDMFDSEIKRIDRELRKFNISLPAA